MLKRRQKSNKKGVRGRRKSDLDRPFCHLIGGASYDHSTETFAYLSLWVPGNHFQPYARISKHLLILMMLLSGNVRQIQEAESSACLTIRRNQQRMECTESLETTHVVWSGGQMTLINVF